MLCGEVLVFDHVIRKSGIDFKPDIVEMCGLLDYLDTALAVRLVKKIFRQLHDEGFFLTCHIHPNHEAYFLNHVVNWWMLYRTPAELKNIVVEGGFMKVELHSEPHGIHSVAVAQKCI